MFKVESCLSAALAYAERGWQVIPLHNPKPCLDVFVCSCDDMGCGSIGKHPRTAHGLKDGAVNGAAIREWWRRWPEANVGIVTGAVSGIAVLDVDLDKGGEQSLVALVDRHGALPDTLAVRTGGGGRHLLFAHPALKYEGVKVPNSNGKLGAGLDVRGDGGYIAAAPSRHVKGLYVWMRDSESWPIEPMPGWLLKLCLTANVQAPAPQPPRDPTRAEAARFVLGKALADAREGNRNEVGFKLACQLRDRSFPMGEAESIMREYAERCPKGGAPYTDREALASLREAYNRPAREPPKNPNANAPQPVQAKSAPKPIQAQHSAAGELMEHMTAIAEGRAYDVGLPWPALTRLTNSLIPGSVTVVCGDPGVGKTFWVLQCLQFWLGNDQNPAVFFVEKDRKFHTHRLLAQLEGRGCFVDWDWIRENPAAVSQAVERNEDLINELGQHIHSAPAERVTLADMLAWVREQCAHGSRVIVIDPITAIAAGKDRWLQDDDFLIGAQRAVTDAGASLMLVTHARKGNRPGNSATAHDQALGAAYHRFSDTNLWINRRRDPKRVLVKTPAGELTQELKWFIQIEKARNGRGKGLELGFDFGEGLKYAEQGVVLRDE